jgi:hypothetical protein
MATATRVTVLPAASQFRGVFDMIWIVQFDLDSGPITGNSAELSTIPVPGVVLGKDVILGWNHSTANDAGVTEEVHVGGDNELHVIRHNPSGPPVNLPPTTFRVVIARLL